MEDSELVNIAQTIQDAVNNDNISELSRYDLEILARILLMRQRN